MKANKYLLMLSVLILANGNAGSHTINFYLFTVVIVRLSLLKFFLAFSWEHKFQEPWSYFIIVQDNCIIFNTEAVVINAE